MVQKMLVIRFLFDLSCAFTYCRLNLLKEFHHPVQCSLGARVYFNTNVSMDDRLIKYGVIDSSSFMKDLLTWESLYIAGRFHKVNNEVILSRIFHVKKTFSTSIH